jgi:hypothetical protein
VAKSPLQRFHEVALIHKEPLEYSNTWTRFLAHAASVEKAVEIFKKQCNDQKQETSARRVGTYPHPQESHTASIHTIIAEL